MGNDEKVLVKRKCKLCKGKKYVEYESGLIRKDCPRCEGRGFNMKRVAKRGNKAAKSAG